MLCSSLVLIFHTIKNFTGHVKSYDFCDLLGTEIKIMYLDQKIIQQIQCRNYRNDDCQFEQLLNNAKNDNDRQQDQQDPL